MTNLTNALQQLREERGHAQEQVQKLGQAISAIEDLVGRNGSGVARDARPKRSVSAAARRRMSRAQKARWANRRKPPQSEGTRGTVPVKRTLSLAARKKIAAAQRARWAKVKAREKKAA
jgi:hypothetical protein